MQEANPREPSWLSDLQIHWDGVKGTGVNERRLSV